MNFLQLEYFLTLAKLGSFRRTAEKHYISQPAVSKQISLLEKEWGVTLFNRSYRSVTLTTAGQIMLEMLEKSGKDFEDALYQARLKSKQIFYKLRMGLPESSNFGNLDFILADFQQCHPEILMKISHVPLSALSFQRTKEDFDIVINYEYNLHDQPYLEERTLAKRRHTAIISKDFASQINFEDLKYERLLIPAVSATAITKDYAVYICECHGFTPGNMEILPNVESVCMSAKMGFGYAILDDLVELPERFELARIPTNVGFSVKLAWHKENQNPSIQLLVDEIMSKLELESTVP